MNVERSKSKYQKFIQSNDYSRLQWARDSSGEISKLYQVRGLPTTYILDREGIIRYAHVGYGGGMDQALAEEVEVLLE